MSYRPRSITRITFLLVLTSYFLSFYSIAMDYPNKPIRLIVGPGPDAIARAVAGKLSAQWGVSVYVEQIPGAGGVLAAQTVAKAPADGYTLLLTTGSYSIMEYIQGKPKVSLLKNFEPVAQIASLPFFVLLNPTVPANSLSELIQLAKSKPGTINCASTGIGTTAHLGCEMLRTYEKVEVIHVPYNGTPGAVTDLIGGRVQMLFGTGPTLVNVAAGKLKVVAVTGPSRYSQLPQLPTVGESGSPQLTFTSWNGIHAPAGTPPEVINKISQDIVNLASNNEIKELLNNQGFNPDFKAAPAFANFVKNDLQQWAKVIKDTGAKAE
ncbi:MAG: tripartite tricarboxylate transporter substrate-binding protein [Betaproteobacteria bacterium]